MHDPIRDDNGTATCVQTDAISQVLAQRIGPQKFNIWFRRSTRLTLNQHNLTVAVANTFAANWIQNHFMEDLRVASQEALGHTAQIDMTIDQSLAISPNKSSSPETPAVALKKPATGPGLITPLRPSRTHVRPTLRLSLDSFIVGPCNELAYNAARAVVREGQSPFNPLFIHGGYGVGKTHLLQGICNAVVHQRPQAQWLYLSAEDFANQFVLALKTKKLETFRRRLRQTDLLAIDDIHFLSNKPSTQEEFLHTFNTISLAGKQVVLVSDAAPKLIDQLSDKLVNRFVSGMVVKIDPPDFTTRCEICRRAASRMIKTAYSDTHQAPPTVPDSVIRFVAESVFSNVRELEGALLKVIASCALQHEPITLERARAILVDHIEHSDPRIHLGDIESVVAQHFSTTPGAIHSTKKDKTVAIARHFSMYLARKYTHLSFTDIGRFMGNKNHATVLTACKKIEDLVQRDAEVHWCSNSGNRVARSRTILEQLETSLGTGARVTTLP